MHVLYGHDPMVAIWVAHQIPQGGVFPTFGGGPVAVGLVNDGELVGGVVWHSYSASQRRIEVSGATTTTRGLTPAIISEVMRYPFGQLKVRRVSAEIPVSRPEAAKFLERLGFRQEGLIREGAGDEDLTLWGILAPEWEASRFYRPRQVAAGLET